MIRLVTGRYYEMQGLTTIADAVYLLGGGLMFAYFHAPWVDSLWHVLPFAILLAGWLWFRFARLNRRIEAFYTARCGRVTKRLDIEYPSAFTQGMLWIPMLFDFRVPDWALAGTAFLLFAAHPIWIVRRDFPYRTHWLLPAVVGTFMAFVLLVMGVQTRDEAVAWHTAAMLTAGAAMAFAGLLDHLLLLRTLQPAAEPDASPETQES